MANFEFCKLHIPEAYEIISFYAEDHRGYFTKGFEQNIFREHGIEFYCNEDFISCSAKNVIRGMHFQLDHPQAKLVGVVRGCVYDVMVDLRKESPTFGKWYGTYLSEENHKSLYIPRGCAHGFLSMAPDSIVSYKCDGVYDKKTDTGIMYNDPDIGISWPIDDISCAILGERDKHQMSFSDFCRNCSFTPHLIMNSLLGERK